MKIYNVDNLNGTSITLVAPNKKEARRLVMDEDSPVWAEVRKTIKGLNYPFTTRSPCVEVQIEPGAVLGVISY